LAGNETPSQGEPAPIAGDAYSELIKEQLLDERNRKVSVEQRGVAVITTSGVLVSLLFGLAALVTTSKQFVLPGLARALLVLSLPLFLLAAILGIKANVPMQYQEAGPEGLKGLLDPEFWNAPAARGIFESAEARLAILTSYRQQTTIKASALVRAMWAEVVGVCLVAIAVGVILMTPVPTGK